MTAGQNTSPEHGWRAHTAILTCGAFAVGSDGFVIVGLLAEINKTLHVSIGKSGQLVSTFAIAYALLSPILATVTSRWPRRRALVAALTLLGVGNAVTALAHDYSLVLASRILAGAGAALFSASAVATASHLAGEKRRGSAIAMVTTGSTLALVLGAPLGTFIGKAWGWQSAIWFVTTVCAIVAVAIAILLPPIKLDHTVTLRQRMTPLTDRRVLKVLAVTLLAFVSVYLPFTYISAVFRPATDGDQNRIALLLLVFGVGAMSGNLMAGLLADRYNPGLVVIGANIGIALVFLLMLPTRESFVLVAIMHALSGVVSFSVIGPQQHRIIAYAPPGAASVVTSLNASTGYMGNFLASILGAAVLGTAGTAALLLPIAAAFAVTAALAIWWFSRESGELGRKSGAKSELSTAQAG